MAMTKAQATTTNDMGDRELQDLLQDWDRMAPVGREFGSPDYERLEELDQRIFRQRGLMCSSRSFCIPRPLTPYHRLIPWVVPFGVDAAPHNPISGDLYLPLWAVNFRRRHHSLFSWGYVEPSTGR